MRPVSMAALHRTYQLLHGYAASPRTSAVLDAEYLLRGAVQDAINASPALHFPMELACLAEQCSNAAKFPQYRGRFDGLEVVRITRALRTKLGGAFEKGDVVLLRREEGPVVAGMNYPSFFAFSFRNGCETGLPSGDCFHRVHNANGEPKAVRS